MAHSSELTLREAAESLHKLSTAAIRMKEIIPLLREVLKNGDISAYFHLKPSQQRVDITKQYWSNKPAKELNSLLRSKKSDKYKGEYLLSVRDTILLYISSAEIEGKPLSEISEVIRAYANLSSSTTEVFVEKTSV